MIGDEFCHCHFPSIFEARPSGAFLTPSPTGKAEMAGAGKGKENKMTNEGPHRELGGKNKRITENWKDFG